MPIAGDEVGVRGRSEGEEIVVVWVGRSLLGRSGWIVDWLSTLLEQFEQLGGILRRHSIAQLRRRERLPRLSEKLRAHNQLEGTVEPELEQPRGRPRTRDQSGDEDVRVEDGPHLAARLVLGLDRQL